MKRCDMLQHYLARHGRNRTESHELLGPHLAECGHCRRLVDAWRRIPALLDELPEHDPGDLAQQRVMKALPGIAVNHEARGQRFPRIASSLATAAVVLAAIGISRHLVDTERLHSPLPALKEEFETAAGPGPGSPGRSAPLDDAQFPDGLSKQNAHAQVLSDEDGGTIGTGARTRDDFADRLQLAGSRADEDDARRPEEEASHRAGARNEPGLRPDGAFSTDALPRSSEIRVADDKLEAAQLALPGHTESLSNVRGKLKQNASKQDAKSSLETDAPADGRERQYQEQSRLGESLYRDLTAMDAVDANREAKRHQQPSEASELTGSKPASTGQAGQNGVDALEGTGLHSFATQTQGLQFQPAEGYWANTHVPGDPAIRLLRSRLAQWDRSGSVELSGLEQQVRPVAQPFDAPADNALALSLMSDANAVDGVTRMRVQVGIRGIEHRRGQRPAMNLALVVDLPPDAGDDTRIAARALLDAALASKQPGDRFSLVINGADGLVVRPDQFRFGPLQLARQSIAGNPGNPASAVDSLDKAIDEAAAMVREGDDPSQPLGSSSILLISAGELNDVDALAKKVHARALEGMTFSVVPLGDTPENTHVEQLVLAGLGQRRVLETPDRARQLIESELHAASRAVARAARLSIRLAQGVQLVDVIGSRRLDEDQSQRVRDIENSMDARLSRNLGIEADRGEDEGGIQIVIPSIFSGDDVTVLLDVVVTQPGEIASVSLRYKDLAFLRNGTLSGQLSLPAGAIQRGPEQNAVIKSVLAQEFRDAAGRAADALGRQQVQKARTILATMLEEIGQARFQDSAFSADPDLVRDQQILQRYLKALEQSGIPQTQLADSLRYAAWAKVHRPPSEWK